MAPHLRKISNLFGQKAPVGDGKPKRGPHLRHSRSFSGHLPARSYADADYLLSVPHHSLFTCTAPGGLETEPKSSRPGASKCVRGNNLRASLSTMASELTDILAAFPAPPAPGIPDEGLQACIQAGLVRQKGTIGSPRRSASSASTYTNRNQRPELLTSSRRGYSEDIDRKNLRPLYTPGPGTPQLWLTRPLKSPSPSKPQERSRTPTRTHVMRVDFQGNPQRAETPKRTANGRPLNDIHTRSARKPIYTQPHFAHSATTVAAPPRHTPNVSAPGDATVGSRNGSYVNPIASRSASTIRSRNLHSSAASFQQTGVGCTSSASSLHRVALASSHSRHGPVHQVDLTGQLRAASLADGNRGDRTIQGRGMGKPFNPVHFACSADSNWLNPHHNPIQIVRRMPADPTTTRSRAGTLKDKLKKLNPF